MDKAKILRAVESVAIVLLPAVASWLTLRQQKEDMCDTVRETTLEALKELPEFNPSKEA